MVADAAHNEPFAVFLMFGGFFVLLAWMGSPAGPFGSGGTCQTNAGICFSDAFNIALPILAIFLFALAFAFMIEMARDVKQLGGSSKIR